MPEIGLEQVRELKKNATALRNMGDYEGALEELQAAVNDLLEMPQSQDVRAELADTYGMRGGVRRRENELQKALGEYRAGYDIEKDLDRGSYNLTNKIALEIATDAPVPPAEMREAIELAVEKLGQETKGPRSDEWWAWSDLGQFNLLLDRPDEARESYRRGRETGPTTQEYKRHLVVLKELAQIIARGRGGAVPEEVSATIDTMATELERFSSS